MTEATKRYIPEINAVDGFSPAEFTRELPSDDGTTSLYMDVKFRLLVVPVAPAQWEGRAGAGQCG